MNICLFWFFKKYLGIIFWILINFFIFWKSYCNYNYKPEHIYLRQILGRGLCISRASATIISLNSFMVIVPVCRTIINLFLIVLHKFLPYAFVVRRIITWLSLTQVTHIVCAYTLLIASVIHTISHFVNAHNFSRHYDDRFPELNWAHFHNQNPFFIILSSWTGISGVILLLILFIILFSSLKFLRKTHYNLFSILHLSFLPYLVLLVLHPLSGILKQLDKPEDHLRCLEDKNNLFLCNRPSFKAMNSKGWIFLSFPLVLKFFDCTIRLFRRNFADCSLIRMKRLSDHVVELILQCPPWFCCTPAQYILLHCSIISNLEWHPYTIIRCPSNECVFSIFIRARGDWSNNLLSRILVPFNNYDELEFFNENSHKPIKFLVDGPYHSPMEGILGSKIVICIAAGIGITPFSSIFHHLLENKTTNPIRIHLIWILRNFKHLLWFAQLLCEVHKKFWMNNEPDRLEIQVFITKKYSHNGGIKDMKDYELLLPRIKNGRPRWSILFKEWQKFYPKEEVCVFSCGPSKMSHHVKKICSDFNLKYKSKFRFIKETFF